MQDEAGGPAVGIRLEGHLRVDDFQEVLFLALGEHFGAGWPVDCTNRRLPSRVIVKKFGASDTDPT